MRYISGKIRLVIKTINHVDLAKLLIILFYY